MTVRLFFVCILLISYCSLYYWDKLIRHFTKEHEEKADDMFIIIGWFLTIVMALILFIWSRLANA